MRAPLLCSVLLATACAASPPRRAGPPVLHDGDIVLQAESGKRSDAIRYASSSPYSHAGLVEVTPQGTFVIEALGRVTRTPFALWVRRGEGRRYTLLRHPAVTPARGEAIVREARRQLGKRYDLAFGWDDRRMYCSELVAKAYARGAGLRVGKLQRIRDLAVTPLLPLAYLHFGGKLPVSLDQQVLTPGSLGSDASLTVVHSDFGERRRGAR